MVALETVKIFHLKILDKQNINKFRLRIMYIKTNSKKTIKIKQQKYRHNKTNSLIKIK